MERHELQNNAATGPATSEGKASSAPTGQDEVAAEVDEPPERRSAINFPKLSCTSPEISSSQQEISASSISRKASLLTQALLSSPEMLPMSDGEAPHFTSDGGITSPTRSTSPSPPPIIATLSNSRSSGTSHSSVPKVQAARPESASDIGSTDPTTTPKPAIEEALGRKRFISFACGKQTSVRPDANAMSQNQEQATNTAPIKPNAARRPCLLRFACPTRPYEDKHTLENRQLPDAPHRRSCKPSMTGSADTGHPNHRSQNTEELARQRHGTASPVDEIATDAHLSEADRVEGHELKVLQIPEAKKSNAVKIHKIAACYPQEDEWTLEQTAYRQKMTISDTLEKENTFRRIAEEAEEEATIEEQADLAGLDEVEDHQGMRAAQCEPENDPDADSDDGNVSDDEGGFAESENESEDESDYHFWTPGITTAATSTEHIDYIRPLAYRTASESSIEFEGKPSSSHLKNSASRQRSRAPSQRQERVNSSEDFIIGTLDEDRPLHDAYLLSVEQRKRSKICVIPQDIDPSFPTSDVDADNDGDESEEDDVEGQVDEGSDCTNDLAQASVQVSGELPEVTSLPRQSAEVFEHISSPSVNRPQSSLPRRLFGRSTHRLRSPPPLAQRLTSPPPSRRSSPPRGTQVCRNDSSALAGLAQRPNLTQTASLPRSENPFWNTHRPYTSYKALVASKAIQDTFPSGSETETHRRGPIDIVQGLEQKRQRRREKFWRLHCQKAHAGKDKERKCQPGKGAQRMRTVGMLCADRMKGYGQNRPNLMLSI